MNEKQISDAIDAILEEIEDIAVGIQSIVDEIECIRRQLKDT